MPKQYLFYLSGCLVLAGCGQSGEYSASESEYMAKPAMITKEAAADGAEAAAEAPESDGTSVPAADIKVSLPQIAYIYRHGYRLDADKIAPLQSAHADLCESKGPQNCRIINLSQSGGEGDYANASLEIEVAAAKARNFGVELSKLAESKGGKSVESSISGEDLSKQIVDTQARLRARIVLRDRLMEILKNRSGKVSELVAAERGVAEVNEEIDRAQSWLAEMKGRVAFSKMTINYNAGSPSSGGFMEPIRHALGSAASILGYTIAFIISAFIFLLPWAAIIAVALWSRKRFGWRFRFWKKRDEKAGDASEQS